MKKSFPASLLPLLSVLVLGLLIFAVVEIASGEPNISFEIAAGKAMKLKIPEISLSDSDKEKLASGKPICRLIDAPGGLKKGYMRVFFPYEAPTVARIAMDNDCFARVDPMYPENKGRRSFMPYTFDSVSCTEGGRYYFYQLLVMPLVDPRHYTLDRYVSMNGFPWEIKWAQTPEMHCKDKWAGEMEGYRKDAILTLKNDGAWHLAPIPKEFVKTKEDLLKTDAIYFVDSNPGGDIAKLKFIINQATKVAMPALAENMNFHGKTWDAHMKKYHADDYQAWKQELADYRKAVGYSE